MTYDVTVAERYRIEADSAGEAEEIVCALAPANRRAECRDVAVEEVEGAAV